MKNKFYVILIIVLAGCSQRNPIERALETKSDEYWCYYRQNDSYFTYFKFDENKLSYRYNRDGNHFTDKPEDPFMDEVPENWSVSEDSIMKWGNFAYDGWQEIREARKRVLATQCEYLNLATATFAQYSGD